MLQWFCRHEVHRGPITVCRSRVRISLLRDPGEADDLLPGHAMIIENEIVLLHGAQMEPRGEIAHTGPRGFAVLHESRPRITFGFLFHEPVVHTNSLRFVVCDLRFDCEFGRKYQFNSTTHS